MRLEDFTKRADKLIQLATEVLNRRVESDLGYTYDFEKYAGLKASSSSFIKQTFGEDSPYYKDLERWTISSMAPPIEKIRGIIIAAKEEMEGGWFQTTRGLVSAEVFADFLGMAEHLLSEKYKDPAAVLIGGVLEEHLRQLCDTNSIPVTQTNKKGKVEPRKASVLNDDLAKKKIYTSVTQRNVSSWQNLRNKLPRAYARGISLIQALLVRSLALPAW